MCRMRRERPDQTNSVSVLLCREGTSLEMTDGVPSIGTEEKPRFLKEEDFSNVLK